MEPFFDCPILSHSHPGLFDPVANLAAAVWSDTVEQLGKCRRERQRQPSPLLLWVALGNAFGEKVGKRQ